MDEGDFVVGQARPPGECDGIVRDALGVALRVGVLGVHGGGEGLNGGKAFVLEEAVELVGVGVRVRARHAVEAADAVTPELLGARDGKLGGQHQALALGGVGAELGAADAECQAVVQGGDGRAYHLRQGLCLREIALGEQDGELLAAVAGRDRDLGQTRLKRLGHVAHCQVARRMAMPLVVLPEVVQVQQQQGQAFAGAGTAPGLLVEPLLKPAVVVQAGQGVGVYQGEQALPGCRAGRPSFR